MLCYNNIVNLFIGDFFTMMLYPSIEKLADKVGNPYILATVVGKRAKELEKTIPEYIDNSQDKAISIAAKELETGKIIAVNPDEE